MAYSVKLHGNNGVTFEVSDGNAMVAVMQIMSDVFGIETWGRTQETHWRPRTHVSATKALEYGQQVRELLLQPQRVLDAHLEQHDEICKHFLVGVAVFLLSCGGYEQEIVINH